MGKTIYKFRFIDGFRLGEYESWLTDMAECGLHLKKLGVIFAHFSKGEPEKIRYRLDVSFTTNEQMLREEYDPQPGLFRENGWEFVCRTGQINVYRSPETVNAPELHSDPAEQAFTLRKLQKTLRTGLIATAICAALIIGLQIFQLLISQTPTLSLIEGNNLFAPAICVLYLFIVGNQLQSLTSVKRLIQALREGRAIDHRANYKKHRRFGAGVALTGLAFVVAVVVICVAQIGFLNSAETLPLENDNLLLLRLADIELDPELERAPPQPGDIERFGYDYDFLNYVQVGWSPYSPVQYTLKESGVIESRSWEEGSSGFADETVRPYHPAINEFRYFKLTFPSMGAALLRDLAKQHTELDEFEEEIYPIVELSKPGLDYFATREIGAEAAKIREVFVQKGNAVICLDYFGNQTMDELAEIVAAYLAKCEDTR
jgi:hypothetical protein